MIFSIISWNMCIESKASTRKTYQLALSNSVSGAGSFQSSSVSFSERYLNMGSTTVPKGLFGQSSYYIGYWDDDGSFRPLPVDTVVELEFRVSWASGRPSITGGTVDSADVSRAFCVANNRLFSYDIGNNVLDSTVVNTGVTSPSFGGGVYSNAVSYNFSYTPSTSSYLSFNLNSAEYVKVAELKTVEAVWTGTLSIEGTVTFEYDRTEKEIMEDIK